MKKILAGFLVVILVLIGILYYQRQKVAGSLQALLKGKSYHRYGIKLEIPPSEGSIKGFIRPYVDLPKIILDLSAWGFPMPLTLEKAVGVQDLWGNGALLIEVPREIKPKEGMVIAYPTFEVGLQDSIKLMGAEYISFEDKKENYQKTVRLLAPQLKLGPLQGVIPEQLVFTMDGVTMKESREGSEEGLELGPVKFGFESQLKGESRDWKLFAVAQGGLWSDPRTKTEVGGWKFQLKGTALSLPLEESKELLNKVKQALGDLKNPPQKVPGRLPDPLEDPTQVALVNFFDKISTLILRLKIVPLSKEFLWEGLKVTDSEGGEKVFVAPISVEASLKEKDEQTIVQADGKLKEIRVATEPGRRPFVLEDLNFIWVADYHNTNLNELTSYILRYYRFLAMEIQRKPSQKDIGQMLWTSLVQYPNQGKFEIKVKRLSYEGEKYSANHQDLSLRFFVESKEVGYAAEDQFSFKFPEDPRKNIENGTGKFKLAILLPWDSLLTLARNFINTPKPLINIFLPFLNKETGLGLDLDLDLGENFFAAQIDFKLMTPLGKALVAESLPSDLTDDPAVEAWFKKLGRKLVRSFIKDGSLFFDLKVERLSKLQKLLEQQKTGASLGLVFLAPYTEVDAKKDTLAMKIEFKDGEILVNGEASESLQKLVGPFFKQYEAPIQ